MGCGISVMYYQFFVAYKIQKRLKREGSSNTIGTYLPTYLPTGRYSVNDSRRDSQLF